MYLDPIITAYTDLIKAKNGEIKTYYQGEPLRIASSNLPCCIISKVGTSAEPNDNVNDMQRMTLRITLITDVRQDLSTAESLAKVVEGVSTLYDLMEGRNADYTLKDTSILNIIRTNLDLSGGLITDIDTMTRIDYGTTLRTRAPEMWTIEAHLDFVCNFVQLR